MVTTPRPSTSHLNVDDLWQGDGRAALPGLSQCDVVLVEAHDYEPQAPGYFLSWQEALAQKKKIVLAAFRRGPPQPPPQLSHCPLVDVRNEVAAFESRGEKVTSMTSTVNAEFARVRQALVDAIDDSVPTYVAEAVHRCVDKAQAGLASDDPGELASLAESLADVFALAAEHNAKGLRERARTAAHAVSTRLIHLSVGPGADLLDFGDDVIDRWAAACDRADLEYVATRVQLVRLAKRLPDLDPDSVIHSLEERWSVMQQHDNQVDVNDELLDLFGYVLADLTTIQVNRLNDGSADEIVGRLDRALPLMRRTGAPSQLANLLCLAAQIHSRLPGGGLLAVRRLEEALRIKTAEYPADVRDFVLRSAEAVDEILESQAENLLNKNDIHGAWNAVNLLARLRGSLPDQNKLAESLACAAQLARELHAQASSAKAAAAQAQHLAAVYARNDLIDLLAAVDSTDASITN